MTAKQRKPSEPHSRYYWILVAVCLLLGLPAAVWIYLEIGNHVTTSIRIPVILLLLPLALLLFVAGWIDSRILKTAPQLVRESDRAALAATLGYDPVTRQPVASVVGTGPTTVGYPQPGYPQAQPGQAAAPYGQAQPGHDVGAAGTGASPAIGYPTASAPYGQADQYGRAPSALPGDGVQPPTSYGY